MNERHDLSLLKLNGYNLVTKLPSCSVHSGVCIYLHDNFDYRILDIADNSDIKDGQFIEICINNYDDNSNVLIPHKKLIIGNIYRLIYKLI